MKQLTININFSAKTLVGIVSLAIGASLLLQGKQLYAQATTSGLSGTFGCMVNKNFQGFNTKYSNGIAHAGALYTITISNGTITLNGIQNDISNYEQSSASMSTHNLTNLTTFTIQADTPSAGISKVTNTADNNSISYTLAVNGGNTIFLMSAPTDRPSDFAVCQKI